MRTRHLAALAARALSNASRACPGAGASAPAAGAASARHALLGRTRWPPGPLLAPSAAAAISTSARPWHAAAAAPPPPLPPPPSLPVLSPKKLRGPRGPYRKKALATQLPSPKPEGKKRKKRGPPRALWWWPPYDAAKPKPKPVPVIQRPKRLSRAAVMRASTARWAARLADPADADAQASGFLGRMARPGEEEDETDGYFSFVGHDHRGGGSGRQRAAASPPRRPASPPPAAAARGGGGGDGGGRPPESAAPPFHLAHCPPLAPPASTRAEAEEAVALLVGADGEAGAALARRFAFLPTAGGGGGGGGGQAAGGGGGGVGEVGAAAATPALLPMPTPAHVAETLRLLRASRAPLAPTLAALARAPAALARADAPSALGALAAFLRGEAGLDPPGVASVLSRIPDVLSGSAPSVVHLTPAGARRAVPPVAAARACRDYLVGRLGVPAPAFGPLLARAPRLLARPVAGGDGLEACVAALSGVARLRRGDLVDALTGCPAVLLATPGALAGRARAFAALGLRAPADFAGAPSLLARDLGVSVPRRMLALAKGARFAVPGAEGGGEGGVCGGGEGPPTPPPTTLFLPRDSIARWSTARFLGAIGASHSELAAVAKEWADSEAGVKARAGEGQVK